MTPPKGWTLIELVITVLLLSVLGAFILSPKITFDWQEQRFAQDWFQALNQAKEYAYFRKQPVTVSIHSDYFLFEFSKAPVKKELKVMKPKFLEVDERAFPLLVAYDQNAALHKGQGWVELTMKNTNLRVDRQTLYAYVQKK